LSSLTFLLPNVHAGESIVETINDVIYNCEPCFQRSSFNAWGRSWVFVCIHRVSDILTYSSSTDDIIWVNSYDDFGLPPLITTMADSHNFDVHYDGTYVHLAIVVAVGENAENILYRRGVPFANGTITWGNEYTAYEESVTYWDSVYPKIGADDASHPWIGWTRRYSYFPNWNFSHFVIKSSTNNGIWNTASGFPYQLTNYISGQAEDPPAVCSIPLGLGIGGATENYDTYVIYGDLNTSLLKGRLWNGAWGNEETITTTLSGYSHTGVSAIGGYSAVWVAWQNDTADLLFREWNYITKWGEVELFGNATSEEVYIGGAITSHPVIGIDGNLTIHAFWIGTRDYSLALGYKNRTQTPSPQWNDFEILLTDTEGFRETIQCREKALEEIMACIYWSPSPQTVNQWALDWAVTDWGDYEPPPANSHIIGWIKIGDIVDTIGLEFDIGSETFTHAHFAYVLIGNYTLNATSCLDDPDQHPFVSWSSSPAAQNPIENTTNPTTTILISTSGTVTLNVECLNESCPHQNQFVNIVLRIDGQPPEHNFDGVTINGGRYRDGETVGLINGTYDLSAYLSRFGFSNWTSSGASGEFYFGNSSIGGFNTTTPFDHKLAAYGISYNLDRRATITKIRAYLWANLDTSKGTCGIYKIVGTDIQNAILMGSTQELTGINTTAMWRNFTFTGGLLLEAGSYALTIHAGNETSSLRGKYDSETGSHYQGLVDDTYANGLSDPFGSNGENIPNAYISIYAEYTYDFLYVHNKTEQTTLLTVYGNGTLTLNLYTKPDMMNLYTWIALLLAALFLMVWSPAWFAWKIKKVGVTVESIERLGYAMLLFIVGFGLLIMCIYM